MSAGEPSGTGGARQARPGQGRHPRRRLRHAGIAEETSLKPKPMIEIGGQPILWHIMKIYSASGVNDFVICCGYKGYVIKEYFANYFLHMSDVTFDMAQNTHGGAPEERRAVAGDAGRHRRGLDDRRAPARASRDYVARRGCFCFTYGDGVADIDIAAAIAFHRQPRQAGDGHRGAAARPLRRAAPRRHARRRLHREAARRRRPGSTAASSCSRRACIDLHRRRRDAAGSASRSSGLAQDGELMAYRAQRLLAADGHAARRERCSRSCGSRARAVEGLVSGTGAAFWRGKRVLAHRAHRLQGRVARALAAAARRRRHRARARRGRRARRCTGCRSRDGDREPDRRPARRRRDSPRRCGAAAADRVPPRRAGAGARQLSRAGRDLRDQHDGHGAPARRAARSRPTFASPSSSPPTRSIAIASGRIRTARTDALGGHDPYSASKAAAELVAASYRSAFLAGAAGVAVATARAGNVIGGGDWCEDRLIPDAVRAWSTRQRCCAMRRPRRDPPVAARARSARRLPASGRAAAGDRPSSPSAYNFGPRTDEAASGRRSRSRLRARAYGVGEWRARAMRRGPARGRPARARGRARRARARRRRALGPARKRSQRTMRWYRRQRRRRVGARAVRSRHRRP